MHKFRSYVVPSLSILSGIFGLCSVRGAAQVDRRRAHRDGDGPFRQAAARHEGDRNDACGLVWYETPSPRPQASIPFPIWRSAATWSRLSTQDSPQSLTTT